MILLIDNYDSFTYNLAQYLQELGREVTVYRNDMLGLDAIRALKPEAIIISPGPGDPDQAGISLEVIRELAGKIPIFGVCLGVQCIGQAFGGKIVRAKKLMHGKTSMVRHDGRTVFSGLESPLEVGRYHSLVIDPATLPACLEVSATSEEGEIMAVRHKTLRVEGVQFHPESVLTPAGRRILYNFITGEESGMRVKEGIDQVISGKSLTQKEAEEMMRLIMDGEATPSQISAFLTGLRLKGETVDEITGFARAMRRKVTKIAAPKGMLVDTCGTGGDKSRSFNVSTAAAFVAAGAGVRVAKHGNRSVSSQCGSADVLAAAGVNIMAPVPLVEKALADNGIAFLFAPLFHPAMKHALGPRREIGIRTVFNILGPLSNPAGAQAQVIGVYDADLTETMARVLGELGSKAAWVVHGLDGLDEITLTAKTKVSALKDGRVETFYIDPVALGLVPCESKDLLGGTAAENAATLRAVLGGAKGPIRDVVLLNAAAVLVAAGVAKDLKEGLAKAAKSVDSQAALKKLDGLVRMTTGKAKAPAKAKAKARGKR
ncbi:MAG: bifunctional anthranilate synthase component II/anthranilate phosphoribosyltransferase [Candidatus Methylomirabilia bacterium]